MPSQGMRSDGGGRERSLTEEDALFTDRTAEDEIRAEMEREATLLKSRLKLAGAKEPGE